MEKINEYERSLLIIADHDRLRTIGDDQKLEIFKIVQIFSY